MTMTSATRTPPATLRRLLQTLVDLLPRKLGRLDWECFWKEPKAQEMPWYERRKDECDSYRDEVFWFGRLHIILSWRKAES